MSVKQFLSSRNIDIPMRNTMSDIEAYKELIKGGGRPTVPCLRIERSGQNVEWLYESLDIMNFIDEHATQLG